jgi:hypothetical protein
MDQKHQGFGGMALRQVCQDFSEAAAVIYLLRRGYIFADCFTHPQAGVSERLHCGDQVHHET